MFLLVVVVVVVVAVVKVAVVTAILPEPVDAVMSPEVLTPVADSELRPPLTALVADCKVAVLISYVDASDAAEPAVIALDDKDSEVCSPATDGRIVKTAVSADALCD